MPLPIGADGWAVVACAAALFEKDELPEADSKCEKAWVLDKYAQLRYRHRELLVRCVLVQRENLHNEEQVATLQGRLEGAEAKCKVTDAAFRAAQKDNQEAARIAQERNQEVVQALKVVRAKEAKEARSAGLVLESGAELYRWTIEELRKLRSDLAGEQASNRQQANQLASLQQSLETAQERKDEHRLSAEEFRKKCKQLEQENEQMMLLREREHEQVALGAKEADEQVALLRAELAASNRRFVSLESHNNRMKAEVELAHVRIEDRETDFIDLRNQHEVILQTFESPRFKPPHVDHRGHPLTVVVPSPASPEPPGLDPAPISGRSASSARDMFLSATSMKASRFSHAYTTAEDLLSHHKQERVRHGKAKQQLNHAEGILRTRTEGTSEEHRLQKHTVRHDLVLALADVAAAQCRECRQEARSLHIGVLVAVQNALKKEIAQVADRSAVQSLVSRLESSAAALEKDISRMMGCRSWSLCSLRLHRIRGGLFALEQHKQSVGEKYRTIRADYKSREQKADLELSQALRDRKELHQCLCDAGSLHEVLTFLNHFSGKPPPTHAIESELAWLKEEVHEEETEWENGKASTGSFVESVNKMCHASGILEFTSSHVRVLHGHCHATCVEIVRALLHHAFSSMPFRPCLFVHAAGCI